MLTVSDPWKFLPFWQDILFLAAAAGSGLWTWLRVRRAHSWPSAAGVIERVGARPAENLHFKPWVGELTYTYVANGQYYSGFHRIGARSEGRAEERISGWKGGMVGVRYSPTKPEISVLLRSDQPGGQFRELKARFREAQPNRIPVPRPEWLAH
jgi:hypothetical protein